MNFSAINSVADRRAQGNGNFISGTSCCSLGGQERRRAMGICAGAEGGGQGDQAETTGEGRSRSELLRAKR